MDNDKARVDEITSKIIAILSAEIGSHPESFVSGTPLDAIKLHRVQVRRVNITMGKMFSVDMRACTELPKPRGSAFGQYSLYSLRNLAPFSETAEKLYLNYREPISRMTIGSLAASIAANHLIQSDLITGYQPPALTKRGVITRIFATALVFPLGFLLISFFTGAYFEAGKAADGEELEILVDTFCIFSLPLVAVAILPGLWVLWRKAR